MAYWHRDLSKVNQDQQRSMNLVRGAVSVSSPLTARAGRGDTALPGRGGIPQISPGPGRF